MKIKKILIGMMAFAVGFVVCKKDEEPKPVLEELLTDDDSKTWQVSAAIAKQNDAEINVLGAQNRCVADNQITLFANYTYEFREGPIVIRMNPILF